MGYRIDEIEGIGPSYSAKLATAKVRTTNDLLKKCGSSKGRKAISTATGVSEGQLLKWANLADLMRITGVGSQFSELLEAAGVDTVKELKMRNAENLAATMSKVNSATRVTRTTPGARGVAKWVAQAAKLAPVITH